MLRWMDKQGRYHHGDLRSALVSASLALIEEGGVQALSLRKAAKKAGVSPAAPYHHFASRSALLAAIAVDGFTLLHGEMERAREGTSTPAERLGSCGRAYVRFARSYPAHFRVMFRPELADRSEFPELEEVAGPVFELLVQTLDDGQASGAVPSGDNQGYVLLAWSIAHGLSSLIVDGPLGTDFHKVDVPEEELAELVIGTLAKLLTGAAEAERRGWTPSDG